MAFYGGGYWEFGSQVQADIADHIKQRAEDPAVIQSITKIVKMVLVGGLNGPEATKAGHMMDPEDYPVSGYIEEALGNIASNTQFAADQAAEDEAFCA